MLRGYKIFSSRDDRRMMLEAYFIVFGIAQLGGLLALLITQKRGLTDLDVKLQAIVNAERDSTNLHQSAIQQSYQQLQLLQASIGENIRSILVGQQTSFERLYQQMAQVSQINESKLENMRLIVEEKLSKIQQENSEKLEKMRATVEEKLQETLEKRLSTSFNIVSERLEMVYKGLGEMQTLATGVGDLKRVLSNVKIRGTWGEVQLCAILQQMLSRDQYKENVQVKDNSAERVEYAVKLPGNKTQSVVWLPIDAKFPLADYYRLLEAQEKQDLEQIQSNEKALENSLKKAAKTIAEKYINPPTTTDFGIMFLPIEGLYAEALRNVELVESLQRDYRVILTGPTTLSAILSSLQIGFKTMLIERRSSEVWQLLEVVRKEFLNFASILTKTRLKLEQAGEAISAAESKSKLLTKKFYEIELENKQAIGGLKNDEEVATG